MAELQINKRYVNEAELGGDLFRQTSFYSDKALEASFAGGYSFNLGKMAFENRDKDLSSIGISMNDYKYLSGTSQMAALETAFNMNADADYKAKAGNIEALKAEIEKGKNQEIYENQNWFVKTLSTVASSVANIGVELYGTIEGILDAGATLINMMANDDSIAEWIARDKTGYKTAKAALEDFNSKYTDIGHGGVGDFLATTMYYAGGMTGALLPALIPGGAAISATRVGLQLGAKALTKATAKAGVKAAAKIGRTAYWVSMGGHAASQAYDYALKNDLDISGTQIGLYALAVTGVEFATEMLGGKLLGGSTIDRMVLGKLASPATKWGSKLSTKSAIGAISYRILGDVVGEGVEEMISEWADGLLYSSMITGNPDDQASWNDILYAGFLGGIMGGALGGARTAMTKSLSVTKTGEVVLTTELTDDQKKNAVTLTKAQSVLLADNLAALEKRISKEKAYDALAREGYITQENAQQMTEKQNQKLIETAAGLGNFFANVGDEEFNKSFNLLTGSIEQQAQSIRNFANRNKPETKIHKELVEEYNRLNPGVSIDIVDDPSIEAKQIQKYVQDKYGVNVLIMKTGAQDGVHEVQNGIAINEHTIGFREDALKELGTKGVLNQIIAHELAHTLAFGENHLTVKNLLQVKRVLDDMGIKTTKVGKSLKLDVTELSEAQADAIAELLLFDDTVVEKILFNEQNIFKKAYNWMKNFAKYLSNPDRVKAKKSPELYKTLVKRMAAYRQIVAQNVGNKEDADKFIRDMSLTDAEIKELYDTYLPTWRTENCSITKYNLNIETLNKMEAVNFLTSKRKNINDEMFDFSRAFDPEYYSVDFINEIGETVPNTPFKEAVQSVVFAQTGYIISNDGWVIDGKNVIDSLNENFVNDLTSGALLTPEGRAKYPTLHHILDANAQTLFIGANGSSATEVRVVFKDSVDDKSFDADYNYVTKELTLTLPRTNVENKIKRSGFEQQLKRCMAMAIADVHSFYGGLVPLVVQQSLNKMSDTNLNKVAKQVLTDEFLATQPSRQNIIDKMVYKITELTTTQRTLDDVTSGFITDGLTVQGYGDFYGVNFAVAGAPKNEDVTKALRAINEQYLPVAFKKSTPVNKVEGQMTFDVSETPEKVEPVKKQEKVTQPKKKLNKAVQPKQEVKAEQPKEEPKLKAPNERANKLTDKIKNFEFSSKYLSQTQKMDKLDTEDKMFDKAVRTEFAGEFGEDLARMTNDDLQYYIEYYKENKYKMSVSAVKTFQFIFEYANRFKEQFNKATVKKLQEFLTLEFNLGASALSTFGSIINEALPIHTVERQMLQEGIEFKVPEAMKTRWVQAVKAGDIVTQTQVEERIKEKGREALRSAPRSMRFWQKGLTKEERRTRYKTFIDKLNGFRYLSMLSNPATHVRNIVSNWGIRALSRTAEAFEKVFDKLVNFNENDFKYLPDQKVTKEDLDFIEFRFGKLLDAVSKVGKYDTRTGTDASHMYDNLKKEEMFNSKILKWAQTVIYDKSLSKMDAKISRPELARVMAQLLTANFKEKFEYEKAHYKSLIGDMYDVARKFEDVREAYDVKYEETINSLTMQRDLADKQKNTKEVQKIKKQLKDLSDLYEYIDKKISELDVHDAEFLQEFVNAKTIEEADALFEKYKQTTKDKEKTTLAKFKKQMKTAQGILDERGVGSENIATMLDVATRKVLTNYLRYENRAFKAWCKLMDASMTMRLLGSVVIPFAKVTTNMTLLIYKYSPATLLRGIKNLLVYGKGDYALTNAKNLLRGYEAKNKTVNTERDSSFTNIVDDFEKTYKRTTNLLNEKLNNAKTEQERNRITKEINNYKNWYEFVINNINKIDTADVEFLKQITTYTTLPEIKSTYGNSWQNLVNFLSYGVDDARFLKAQIGEDLATGTVGTLLLLFGVLLAELGFIEKDDDDEKYGGYILHIPGVEGIENIQLKLSDIAPGATPLIAGAAIAGGAKRGGLSGALSQWWEQVSKDTLYGSFNEMFEGYGDGIIGKVSDLSQTYFTQYVPAILRSIQKHTNDKAAVNYQNGWFNTTFERILSALPGVSGWTLPSKVDEYTGQPVTAYNSKFLALLNIFLPASLSWDKTDETRKLAQSLGATTTVSTGKITINDTDYNLKGVQKQQFQTDRAKYINTLITDFSKDKTKVRVQQEDGTYKELTYSQMTDAEKQTAFKSYYSKATNYAKIDYWVKSGHKYVTSSRDEYNTLKKLGINATYQANVKGSKYKN